MPVVTLPLKVLTVYKLVMFNLSKILGQIIVKYQKVLIPELNMGQLSMLIRSKYLVDAIAFNKIQGKPFTLHEVYNKIKEINLI